MSLDHEARVTTGYQEGFQTDPVAVLPEHYSTLLDGQKTMPRQDLFFIDGLFNQYGIGPSEDPESADRLPASVDRPVLFEMARAMTGQLGVTGSPKRKEDLSYLFLHYPPVKRAVETLHVETFTEALPKFQEELSATEFKPYNILESLLVEMMDQPVHIPPSVVRQRYMEHAHNVMKGQLTTAVDTLYPFGQERQGLEDVGIILANSLPVVNRHEDFAEVSGRQAFAVIGTHKFKTVLEAVVNDGLEKGEDLQSKLYTEFLTRRGTPFTLMRTSLRSAHALDHGDTLPGMRDAITQAGDTRRRGRCPSTINRLAYRYASVIVANMPQAACAV